MTKPDPRSRVGLVLSPRVAAPVVGPLIEGAETPGRVDDDDLVALAAQGVPPPLDERHRLALGDRKHKRGHVAGLKQAEPRVAAVERDGSLLIDPSPCASTIC